MKWLCQLSFKLCWVLAFMKHKQERKERKKVHISSNSVMTLLWFICIGLSLLRFLLFQNCLNKFLKPNSNLLIVDVIWFLWTCCSNYFAAKYNWLSVNLSIAMVYTLILLVELLGVDWAEILKATGWRYILLSNKVHVATTGSPKIREEFQERSPHWSNLTTPYWQICKSLHL
jgi:Na+/citrate or Na+/malate symporter